MAFQFNGFKATRPVVCLIDEKNFIYQVFFLVYDPSGRKYQKRFKQGINSFPVDERRAHAQALANVLWEDMIRGWNPLLSKEPERMQPERPMANLNFNSALDHALAIKKEYLSQFSYPDYNGTVRFMKNAAFDASLSNKRIAEIERRDIRLIVATAKEQNNWSNNARNKYLTILKSLLSVLEDQDIIKYNPASKIKDEPTGKSLGYKRLTDDERDRVVKELIVKSPDFFEYLLFIYQDGIRRKELLYITCGDVNLTKRIITITADVAKTNREREVPITDEMHEILLRREVFRLPKSWYIFSANGFKPGEKKFHPNTPTKWWRQMVIEGMKIDCKMYSLKHKGADDKILAGIDLDALKNLYGHRSTQMTEIYAKAIKNKYQQQIIDQAPALAKVVKLNNKTG